MTRAHAAHATDSRAGLLITTLAAGLLTACPKPQVVTAPPAADQGRGSKSGPVAADVAGPAVAEVAQVDGSRALSSRVTKVTVYSDRARVTRRASAKLSGEPTVFAFRKLPGWVDDSSVRVAVSAGRIVDVRVERDFLARTTDKTWQRANKRFQELSHKLAALDDELAVLAAQKQQVEAIKAFSLEKINRDAVLGDIKVKSYKEVLQFIGDALRQTARKRREVQQQREEVTPEHKAAKRRLDEMKNLMKLEQTTVLVTLQSSRPVQSTVDLTYMIPGVTWEPVHDLRVSTASASTAELVSYAVVTQTSGEDWQNAQLAFSTQSSVRSVRIPELEALTLGDTHTASRILTSKMTSFQRAEQAFRAQSQLWNKVHQQNLSRRARLNFDRVFKSNIKYLEVVRNKTVRIFQSLQNRGTTAHFKASAAPSVRGDGHPVRMRIGASTLKTKQKIVAVPEQSLNAARTLEMQNSTGQSFLPGKVALYQDGAFLGMTEIDFIAQGETFALFLSVADQIKLSRRLDRKHSALVRGRTSAGRSRERNKMRLSFIVTVENLAGAETELTLADRIPVSENKEIRIDRVRISGGVKPDSQGLLHWKLRMKPHEKREFRVAYRVEYPSELVLETRRRRARRKAMNRARRRSGAAAPQAAPAKRRPYKIEDQLFDLEQAF